MSDSFDEYFNSYFISLTKEDWEYHALKSTWEHQQAEIDKLLEEKRSLKKRVRNIEATLLYKSNKTLKIENKALRKCLKIISSEFFSSIREGAEIAEQCLKDLDTKKD